MRQFSGSLGFAIAMALPAFASAAELRQVAQPVDAQYIVVLKQELVHLGRTDQRSSLPEVVTLAVDLSAQYDLQFVRSYQHVLPGFVVRANAKQLERLLFDPRVDYVEQDGIVTASATQTGATWGIDRVDQRNLPLNSSYIYDTTASNVHAYIVDTGVLGSHTEFSGRMSNGYTAISDANGTNDCNGHGTHVAGTVGGTTYGVAKQARIPPVRVLGCDGSGTNSGVIAGMDWVAANRVKPAVANMSLGGGASTATDDAVQRMHAAGVTVVVAAGNDNANACNYSPARAANAITVGSTTNTDARSSFSNFGTCLDIFGPGSNITSSWYTSSTATNTISGTSMASPHVAGVAALWLANNPAATPAQVATALINNSTLGKVTSPGTGSANRLLHSLFGATPPPGNVAPTANFSFTTSGLTATFTDSSSDSDGSIASRSWNFGDGTTSTATSPSKTYAAAGTYTVTLTVTDNGGLTNTKTSSVTVATSGGGAVALSNGVAAAGSTNSTSANSSWKDYTVAIPAGASNLTIVTSGASGDVDLHVKFGAQATTSVYDCRPYASTGNETCTFATPSVGTYYVRVYGYQTGTVTFNTTASWTVGGGGTLVERMVNGNFDSITSSGNSGTGWARSAFTGTSFNTLLAGQTNANTGGSYANLGVNATTSTQTVDSNATLIPAGATTATLSFFTSIVTSETSTTSAYDKLQVQLVDASTNAVITTLVTLSNVNKTASASTYVQRSYNVAAYKGRNVKVRLIGSTDSSLATTFRVDTVSLRTDG
ncbi:MAG: S8 family serine peptidase [Rhodanobacteraceae bacterium]|nr:S8 family serine peptidase [Rhodanobacteraceae bacterium]